jgi:hypothetical protein
LLRQTPGLTAKIFSHNFWLISWFKERAFPLSPATEALQKNELKMKIIIAVIAGAAISLAATSVIVSKKKEAAFAKERQTLKADWESQKAELEADLKRAKNKPARIETIHVPASGSAADKRSPQETIEKLKAIKVGTGPKRAPSIRQVVHHLESLAEAGPGALPAIREFLGKFEDVEYSSDAGRDKGDDEGQPANRERREGSERPDGVFPKRPEAAQGHASLDFVYPPSLRLGLVDVLKEIGGEDAEKILAEMLAKSGRGVEVAYVAKTLQAIVPNKYRDVAVAAAKDLLANPPAIDRPNRLDENSKSYLYSVLSMYNDSSFTAVAHDVLVGADGKIDRTALNYLTTTFKDQAIPVLYQAYKDDRITNLWDKASLAGQALNYAGNNSQANDIFKEIVNNEALPIWMRAMTIQSLNGTSFFGGSTPTDPQQIQSRIKLLTAMSPLADEQMERARTETVERLNNRLSGKPEGTPESTPNDPKSAPGQSPSATSPPGEISDR